LVLTLVGIVFLAFTDPNLGPGALVLFVPLCAGVWAAGRLVAARARAAAALRARTDELERQRTQTAQLTVEVERTRLTSELDGAVREHMSEIVQLAELGEQELAGDETAARGAFERIETAGRASLDEMRGLLGAMRSDGRADRTPRPTLAELDALLAEARAGGRAIDLDIAGDRRPLSEGIELAAYRIVEHALAAADGDDSGSVSVRLRFAADVLEVEVEVDHRDLQDVVEQPIVAAREQVTARGGTLILRPAGPGRRALCARLPLVAEHA
ncbi:MAG: histidine kinase, partial [Actinomycetota bacterium]|nr:histidine kinase [Actinomycetota bacterium]